MKLPVTISLLLCLAVYAMQIATPCQGSCGVDKVASVSSCCTVVEVNSCCCATSCCEDGCRCSMDDSEHVAELSELLSVNSSIITPTREGRLVERVSISPEEVTPPNKAPPPLSGKDIRVLNESFRL